MDWSTSVAISVKANISPSPNERHACVEDAHSQMMEKEKRSSPSDPLSAFEDLQETSHHFCLVEQSETTENCVHDLLCGAI